jgi:hypothetical protein
MRNERPCETKQAATPAVSTKRSVAECAGAQRRSVAAVLARAAKKNTTRSAARCGDFFKPLVLPLQVCFCETKGAIDEYLFTCTFCAEALQ